MEDLAPPLGLEENQTQLKCFFHNLRKQMPSCVYRPTICKACPIKSAFTSGLSRSFQRTGHFAFVGGRQRPFQWACDGLPAPVPTSNHRSGTGRLYQSRLRFGNVCVPTHCSIWGNDKQALTTWWKD